MRSYAIRLRVLYKDTDQMGVVYYSNYFVWFEQARAELFRKIGHPYKTLEARAGLRLMVVEAQCMYKAPAEYDDLLKINCRVAKIGNSSLAFEYEVKKDRALIAEGMTVHCFTDSARKPRRIPLALKGAFRK